MDYEHFQNSQNFFIQRHESVESSCAISQLYTFWWMFNFLGFDEAKLDQHENLYIQGHPCNKLHLEIRLIDKHRCTVCEGMVPESKSCKVSIYAFVASMTYFALGSAATTKNKE